MSNAKLSTLVRNEQIKLLATAFNNVGVAFIVTGIIAPAAALAYQISSPHGRYWGVFVLLWMAMGVISNLIGRYILTGLTP